MTHWHKYRAPQRKWLWRISLGMMSLACLTAQRSYANASCRSDGRYVMGTVLEITLCHGQQAAAQFDALFAQVSNLEAQLTTFSPTSTVSQLNARAGQGPMAVPPAVHELLTLSLRYWQQTRGTFDVTVGPIVTAWRQATDTNTFPSKDALRQARGRTGARFLSLSKDGHAALQRTGMRLDLGGIGKGYAIDKLKEVLHQQNALLNFGQSSIWALGTPTDAPGWRLIVQRPNGEPAGVVTLRDQALSISGTMGQPFVINGQSYGHIIDPRSGQPLQRNLQACVLAPTATQAEALSKALLVLGEKQGIALLHETPNVEGLLLDTDGHHWMTKGWQTATQFVLL
ncbi:MAG: FAD:protein FMN transferase [Deltaproteobacteria bacterium]|nr:FAD:protein FMN transferase [Deltaproteobacteria bacterium]